MRLMVIGGAGFLGSHLVDRSLAEQHTVDVVDDLSTGSLANLAEARAHGGDLKIHHLDACAEELAALVALREPDVVVHLATLVPGSTVSAAHSVQSTLNVLEAAHAHQVAKVVTVLPAGALYGEVPARELPVKEGRAWQPIGVEGVIARTIADLCAVYRQQHALEFTALALTEVYGPRQRSDGGIVGMLAAALAAGDVPAVVGDGRQARDFLYVDDAVDAIVRATRRGSGLVVNVGTGILTPVRDVWSMLAGPGAAAVRSSPAPADDLSRVSVSPTRARIHLAWAPWTALDEGLRSLR